MSIDVNYNCNFAALRFILLRMNIYKKAVELLSTVENIRNEGKKIGFVPTMGALHEGHLSLIEKSIEENDFTIASIFVNPIQFNNKNDFDNYPIIIDEDIALLEKAGCNALFLPSVSEMYPENEQIETYDFGQLETYMEGEHRPGHFNGVAVVVKRLFEKTNPHRAYFGLKDFQQLAIVKELVKKIDSPIEIIPCETVRENDGLAMSSRNVRLTDAERISSVLISKTLFQLKESVSTTSDIDSLKKYVINTINSDSNLDVEYFEIADKHTLEPLKKLNSQKNNVACIAVNVGKVRLIDNIIL